MAVGGGIFRFAATDMLDACGVEEGDECIVGGWVCCLVSVAVLEDGRVEVVLRAEGGGKCMAVGGRVASGLVTGLGRGDRVTLGQR